VAWVDGETIVLAPGFAGGLQQVSVVDGSTRELTELADGERSHRWPSPIPGQRAVIFMTQFPGRHYQDSDIEIVSLDDGERRILHRGGAYPRYSPTGHLVFARESSLFAVPFDPASGTVHGLAVPVLDKVLARVGDQEIDDGSAQFGFDYQGTLLYRSAMSSSAQRSRLAWLDLETASVDPFGDIGLYEGVSISPDGQRIAVRRGEGSESQIIILEATTGAERALTSELGMKYAGDWSHDSRSYYWTQGNAGGTGFEAVRADVDGSRPAEVAITFSNLGFVSDVSPDGRAALVSYMTLERSYDLGYVDLASGNPKVQAYVSSDSDDVEGRFHPDGRLVLYDDSPTDLSHLMIRRFPDTGERWQVSIRNSPYEEHHWSADGSAVIVREGEWLKTISVERRDGRIVVGAAENLVEQHGLVRLEGGDLAIHPDGKRALILVPESTMSEGPDSQIILRTGWFEELERLAGTK
jgi:Tol biopolymer transport system component